MKALILAAGHGTRLRPYTNHTPKPLFPISGHPLIHQVIENLIKAGCHSIIINTHHLGHKIKKFIKKQNYPIPVTTRYEPEILGTGGAIKNTEDFWDEEPFFVINSDIVTDISLKAVYEFHRGHTYSATLVLKDDPEFNFVSVDHQGKIKGFSSKDRFQTMAKTEKLAFTGIQVLNPEILHHIPPDDFYSSIDAFRGMMAQGKTIKAYIARNFNWIDIGTPERYQKVIYKAEAPVAFQKAGHHIPTGEIKRIKLKGDGSDRKWYRLISDDHSIIMVDHGIKNKINNTQVDSFINIGRHLHSTGIPVPKIYHEDAFSGMVFLEDLGDVNLQEMIENSESVTKIQSHYQSVINHLVNMSQKSGKKFDPSWTYQTRSYNREMILENECKYFIESFINNFLQQKTQFNDLRHEFTNLSDQALKYSMTGFIHRDMQSRNIMIQNNEYFFIDFQGGRLGPIQYDLASLLIDPYVKLPISIQDSLLEYCIKKLSHFTKIDPIQFKRGYSYCKLTRNLQMLGAFSHLTKIKKKEYFRQYIKPALKTLLNHLENQHAKEFPKLLEIVAKASKLLD